MTNEKLKKARERVKKKKEFYSHLSTYVVMGIFFFVLNAVTAFGSWWFHWPLLGWGIGVLFHYFDVFGLPGVGDISDEWEAREIEAEMRRMGGSETEETDELELKEMQKERAEKKRWDDSELV
jgi:hypothetical protein